MFRNVSNVGKDFSKRGVDFVVNCACVSNENKSLRGLYPEAFRMRRLFNDVVRG